jgi:hypothetical protein
MTEQEFRRKYPHSTDEQVRLYAEAVAAEAAGHMPAVEPDIPMAMVTVPERVIPTVTTYASSFFARNFHLDDVPPEWTAPDCTGEMREILLGRHGFNAGLSPASRQRLETTDMTEDEMLAMLVGAPSAREFADLA